MITPAERAAIVTAYTAPGATIDSVAGAFDRTFNTVRDVLREAGVIKPRGRARMNSAVQQDTPQQLRRRFARHGKTGHPMRLDADHSAVVEGRTIFPNRRVDPADVDSLLKSGLHQRKIGDRVTKGAWRGFPIYTLTLEERATCPRSCHHYASCMGNRMSWPTRLAHGAALEARLEVELAGLQRRHRRGFVVRLHILGDFYSVAYVERWQRWLDRFPALRVFGYTAWPATTPIRAAIAAAAAARWERFAIRFSTDPHTEAPGPRAVTVVTTETRPKQVGGYIVCPSQTGRAAACGSCALCWATTRPIAFLLH